MIVGFTGTREGMTPNQRSQFWSWVHRNELTEWHHGCCLGADFSATDIVDRVQGYRAVITAYPSDLTGMTSDGALRLSKVVHPARPPLKRNRDIVDACDVLLACPEGPEVKRSGTWATVRYARKQRKRIVIFWPDGTVTEEAKS